MTGRGTQSILGHLLGARECWFLWDSIPPYMQITFKVLLTLSLSCNLLICKAYNLVPQIDISILPPSFWLRQEVKESLLLALFSLEDLDPETYPVDVNKYFLNEWMNFGVKERESPAQPIDSELAGPIHIIYPICPPHVRLWLEHLCQVLICVHTY